MARILGTLLLCIALLSQKTYANSPPPVLPFPNPQECMQSFKDGGVCFQDMITHFGKPSEACCTAFNKIDDKCWPSVLPFLNPFIVPFVKNICSGGAGAGSTGGGAFPFPFPFPGGGSAGGSGAFPLPFPFPGGGSAGGGAFPFPPFTPSEIQVKAADSPN